MLKVPEAWGYTIGEAIPIAVLDTGVQATNPDLAGKVYKGVDTYGNKGYSTGNTDIAPISHGTAVATVAAAITNNGKLTAAPASDAYIFPVRIADANVNTDTRAIIKGLDECIRNRIRICNISYSANEISASFFNPKINPLLHQWLKAYHDSYDGLIIMSAGNARKYDPSPRSPYLIIVTATDPQFRLADFSNWGTAVWFAAPGVDVSCSDRNGKKVGLSGTSFAAPLVAGIAAMIWAKAPSLPNTTIERILINSCEGRNIAGSSWNTEFGFGMPDAAYCMKNLARYNRGIGDDDANADDSTRKPPVYEGPAFEIEPVDTSANSEEDTKNAVPQQEPRVESPNSSTEK